MTKAKRTNRLADETSPYLRQHAHNPVDWFPWGPEALAAAKQLDRPIFLSIGYSACHWCHVMERESFEDPATADVLNASFVSIKVDREERPDVDHIYMSAVQMMNRQGGWPLSVFLTPDLKPFYGGTYFPPDDRHGLPAFRRVLQSVAQTWSTKRDDLTKSADQLLEALQSVEASADAHERRAPHTMLLEQGVINIGRSFDTQHGGFGTAPKFFHVPAIQLCFRVGADKAHAAAMRMAAFTLHQIARGGIYDQLGGGFHRYSTDAQWLAPHFEKMLYDNALLVPAFVDAYRLTGESAFRETAREVLNYLLREMHSPEGLFYSTQDADSEGEEGKFFVWSRPELDAALGAELANIAAAVFDVSAEGNWEGKNILRRLRSDAEVATQLGLDPATLEDSTATAKRKLFDHRARRIAPERDEKALTNWNGLALSAFARGFQVLRDERFLEAAQNAGAAILQHLGRKDAGGRLRLFHTRKEGVSRIEGFLDDYAFAIQGLTDLFQCDFDPQWLRAAQQLTLSTLDLFWDRERSFFYLTPRDGEKLITRPREEYDGALPSGEAVFLECLLKLGDWLDQPDWRAKAERALEGAEPRMRLAPNGTAQYLLALDRAQSPATEAILAFPDDTEAWRHEETAALQAIYAPRTLTVAVTPKTEGALAALLPGLADKKARAGKPTLYWCERYTCAAPEVGTESIEAFIKAKKHDTEISDAP